MLNSDKGLAKYLKISELEVGQQYSKIAYLQSFKSGTSTLKTGYYAFHIKDIDGNITVGMYHNVADFIESGRDANAMKKKPIKIDFIATEFNGSISAHLIKIETYTEPDFPYELFVGKVANVEKSAQTVNGLFQRILGEDYTIDERYNTLSIDSVYSGKCGGYTKLMEMIVCDLIGHQGITNLSFKTLVKVFYEVQRAYFLYLYSKANTDIVRNADALEIINSACLDVEDKEIRPVVQDALLTLCGITANPEQLYAVLVVNLIRNKLETFDITSLYGSMIVGGEKVYKNLKLVKY